MSSPKELPLQKLQFYVTTPYACGYIPNKRARSLIAAPQHLVDAEVYSGLIQQGFRRSGKFSYRPHCEQCNECIPVRLVLDQFNPTRSQKRAFKQHADLTAHILPMDFQQVHFELYAEYQSLRHAEDDNFKNNSEADNIEQYRQFLCQSNVESMMVEFRDADNQVKIISVVDIVNNGISAVYTFYDAKERKASYGTYAVMWLADWAKKSSLQYMYLGYWVKDSQKMVYKQNFKPLEKLIKGKWST